MAPNPMAPNHGRTTGLSRRGLLRTGVAGVAAGLGGPLLAGCSRTPAGNSSGGKTFTIYWNAGHAYKTYAKVIKKFESDHGVTVNWQKFQWPDLLTKLQADLQAGNPPDLCEHNDLAVRFAVTGDVMAMDKYIAKDGEKMGFPDDWQPGSLAMSRYQNKTYSVPLHLTCQQLYYNKGMLADAGFKTPPSTWDDFLTVAKAVTKGNRYGVSLNSVFSYSWSWFQENGVKYFNPSNKQLLKPADAAIEALQFQYDLIHKYKVAPQPPASQDYSGPQKMLSAKRAAMILTGPWDIGPIHQGSPKLDLGIALPLKNKNRSTYVAGSGLMIPTKAKHPDLAWDLIKRLTTLDVELAATKETGMTMPRKTWAKNPQVSSDPEIGAVAKALPYAEYWYDAINATGKGQKVEDAFKTMYESAILSGQDPAKSVKTFWASAAKVMGTA